VRERRARRVCGGGALVPARTTVECLQ
jgi:hypothetical protein